MKFLMKRNHRIFGALANNRASNVFIVLEDFLLVPRGGEMSAHCLSPIVPL